MKITGLTVWRIEPSNPQPTGFGIMNSKELSENTQAESLCAQFVNKLWEMNIDRTDTRVHVFESDPDKIEHASEVQHALWELARAINLRDNSEKIARWVSESRWSQRYVLLTIGFEKLGHSFVELVLTESAKDETFLITKEKLVSELEDIFKRVIYKGIIYPYYDYYDEDAVFDKAKVYQASSAQYILDKLGLVQQISASQLVSEALRALVREPSALLVKEPSAIYDFPTLAHEIVATAASAHQQTTDAITEALQTAPINVNVDSIKLQASFREILDGRVSVSGAPGQYVVTVRGQTVDIKSGNQSIRLEDLFREE